MAFARAPLAFAVAIFPPETSLDQLTNQTPIIWTRGLRPDGKWDEKLGVYGDRGGFVAFSDGRIVRFVGGITRGLVKFGTNEPTSNIIESLPSGARISEFTPPKQ